MLVLVASGFLAACSSAPYRYETQSDAALAQRAVAQTGGGFVVRAAVPGAEEAESLLGIDVYERDVQPVWIEIRNDSDIRARVIISSVDPKYFPPGEVAWFFKKNFSKQGWMDMEKRLIDLALPRHIEAGATASGYIFTHLSPGTKAFNLDIFRGTMPPEYEQFTFFLRVPGFVPDYANVRFQSLYTDDQIQQFSRDGVTTAIASLGCCTTDAGGSNRGRPVNVYLVSEPLVLLKSLLRAGWVEKTISGVGNGDLTGSVNHFFGRPADGNFRKPRDGTTDRTELAIWKTPVLVDGRPLWAAQVRHAVGRRFPLGDRLFGVRLDPDVDEGRNYVLQTFWYAQVLEQWGMSPTGIFASQNSPELDLMGNPWFSRDEKDVVLWLSDDPVPMNEARYVDLGGTRVSEEDGT